MHEIRWLTGMEAARGEARMLKKPIFIFFHHPNCGGCIKSKIITLLHSDVVELLERSTVAVNFTVTEAEELTARYRIEWTPTFILADEDGLELERWVGYLPPEDFINQFYLASGLAAFHRARFKEAENAFEWIIDNRPDAAVAPMARYYMGVALYKDTGDGEHLARTWESMSRRYPGDHWTKKASAWS